MLPLVIRSPLFLFLFVSCSNLFYQPDKNIYITPDKLKVDYEDFWFKSSDGTKLHGQLLKAKGGAKGLVLYFHGNAENLSSHLFHLFWITDYGYDLMIFDYRGYGRSEGVPSQSAVVEDGMSAVEYAKDYFKENEYKKYIIYGKSLGGIVAMKSLLNLNLESKDILDLLVIDSSFSSYEEMAVAVLQSTWLTWPFSPLAYLLVSDENAVEKELHKFSLPTLVIHSQKDEIIPYKFGTEIYNKINASKKYFWSTSIGHNDSLYFKNEKNQKKLTRLFSDIWPKK